MIGGAGGSYEEQLLEAIPKTGYRLKLDYPVGSDGNCGSQSIMRQCERKVIKEYLQKKGITLDGFMDLKCQVKTFIKDNLETDERIQDMRYNFLQGQDALEDEGRILSAATNTTWKMNKRTWEQFWDDMVLDGSQQKGEKWWECWADETWLQAAGWFLDLPIVIVWAGDRTGGRILSKLETWTPVAEDEDRPTLYLGYIVRAHFQPLIPENEQRTQQMMSTPGVEKTKQSLLQKYKSSGPWPSW